MGELWETNTDNHESSDLDIQCPPPPAAPLLQAAPAPALNVITTAPVPVVKSVEAVAVEAVPLPVVHAAPLVPVEAVPVHTVTSSQYHSQDEAGNYKYGYKNINSAKEAAGNIHEHYEAGYYTDMDTDRTVQYVADGDGFREI